MEGMEDARIRLGRAKANFGALKNKVATFPKPYAEVEFVGEDENGELHSRVVALGVMRPPKEWGLLSGDIFVDLRCALDYAVYRLAIEGTGDPPRNDHRLEFPICKNDPLDWRQAIGRKKLDGVTPKAIDFIESIQAYQPGNGGDTSALGYLEELVGVNKHRFIPVAWSRLDSTLLQFDTKDIGSLHGKAYHLPGELKDGTVLADFFYVATGPDPKFEVQPTLTTFVVIEPTSAGWVNLLDYTQRIGPYTEYVVDELERFLTPGHEAPPLGTPIPLTPW
jgi:hypothetical protein